MHMGQSVRLQGDKCRINQNLMHCCSFNLPHCSDCSSHREHSQGFFLHQGITELCKPSSFKSRALKFPTKSIIKAALSTNLILFFYTLSCSRPPISLPLHTHMRTHSRIPWFDLTRGLLSKRPLFNTFTVLKWLKAMWDTYLWGKFCLCFIFQNAMSVLLEAI